MRDIVLEAEVPTLAHILEGQIATISECDILERKRRVLPPLALPLHAAQPVLKSLLGIGVHHVPGMAGGDEDVLPPVEIDVEKHRGP